MMQRCHGRIRNPDDSGQRYMHDCYSCHRFTRYTVEDYLWMKTPSFDTHCPEWVFGHEPDPDNERWPEEPGGR